MQLQKQRNADFVEYFARVAQHVHSTVNFSKALSEPPLVDSSICTLTITIAILSYAALTSSVAAKIHDAHLACKWHGLIPCCQRADWHFRLYCFS
jgi:hypothetical protein